MAGNANKCIFVGPQIQATLFTNANQEYISRSIISVMVCCSKSHFLKIALHVQNWHYIIESM